MSRSGYRFSRAFDVPAGTASIARQAKFLANWVRPERLQDFQTAYERVWQRDQAGSWAVLVAKSKGQIVAEVCDAAAKQGFLARLAEALAELERAAGRAEKEIVEMIAAVKGKRPKAKAARGEMQAIIDQLSGLMGESALFAAADAARACAIVYHGGKLKGTAFLVRDNMVMTAAHVALGSRADDANDFWTDKLADGLSFSFRARPNRPLAERVTILPAARDALRKFSKPYGKPDDIGLDFSATAKPTFDYALIQLAEPVTHIVPIEVDPPSAVERDNKCWAMGFPGGTALMLDYDKVVKDDVGGGRWLHLANTTGGMSGGCCINHLGRLAGLHEGTVTIGTGKKKKRYNRGIGIAEIRNDQKLGDSDPLTARTVTLGVSFDDAQMVADLWRIGALLANPALAPVWDAAMRSVFPDCDPSDLSSLPGFHPWFERRALRDWIGSDNPRERLCLISGPRGAGASFCKQILRVRLGGLGWPYIELSPTQVAAFGPAEALGVATEPSTNRTSAASFRYLDAQQLIDQLRSGNSEALRPSTVVIDFGPDGGLERLIGNSWQQFIVQLLAETWIRVMLIGLSRDEQFVLSEALRGKPETETLLAEPFELKPIEAIDLENFAIALRDARGFTQQVSVAELRQRIEAVVGKVQGLTTELQTVKYTLAAILLERQFRNPA